MIKKILIGALIAAAALVVVVFGFSLYAYSLLNAEGEYFDSSGVRIHYITSGKGTPVILVHGLAVNAGINWVAPGIFPKLARDYQVIAMDTRGHGRSDKPHDADLYGTEMVEDIVRLMDHLEIEKAHVIGYSMGGFIALKLATMHPERLLSVAPCGAGWTARPDDDFKFIRDVADALDAGQGFTLLIQRLQPAGKPPNLLQGYLVNALMLATNDVKAVAAALRGMEQLQVTESELRNNRAPALAIIGENDPLKVVADQMAAVMANLAYAVIPNSDHVSTLTQLKTIETFQEFLAQDTPNTAPSAHACRTLN